MYVLLYACMYISMHVCLHYSLIYDTGSEFGIWKWWDGSCIAVENSWQGCQWVHRQISVALPCMHSAFPAKKGKQTILTSFSDVTNVLLMHQGRGYIRKVHSSLRAVIWVFGAEHYGNIQRGHWPSVVAIMVPLVEQKYIPEVKCALLIHLHMPQVV